MPDKSKSTTGEAAEATGRFLKARPDSVKKLQEYAANEAKRKEAEKKKKPVEVKTGPSEGIMQRMYDYFTKKEK